MTDTEIIFLVLAAIYLWECACWAPAGAVCFSAGFGRPKPIGSVAPLDGNSGRMTLASPLPLATTFVCQEWPLPLDAFGMVVPVRSDRRNAVDRNAVDCNAVDRGASADRWLAFDAVTRVATEERHVLIDGRKVATLASHAAARLCVQRLETLLAAGAQQREQVVCAVLDELCDTAKIAAKQENYQRVTASLRMCCVCLWLAGFVAAPIVYWQSRSLVVGAGWIVLSFFLILWLAVVGQTFFVRRRLVAESRWSSLGHTLLLALSPASAMRAAETLGRDQFAAHEPVAVAAVVCSPDDLGPFAAERLRALRYPLPGDCLPDDSDAGRAQAWFRGQMTIRLERALRDAGADVASLGGEPPRSPDAEAFCPRCQMQYVFTEGHCPDCSLPVRPFATTPSGSNALAS